jgi:outer membrane lipoprotein-sorting protein
LLSIDHTKAFGGLSTFCKVFCGLTRYNHTVVPRIAALVVLLAPLVALGADARSAVEGFVARVTGAQITELAIEQTFTLFHPDGRHPQSTGEQRVWIKVPGRQRVEQVVEGRREVRLSTGDQVWIRTAEGRVHEAPASERERDRTRLLMPSRRAASDVLAEWRALGVRDDVSHVTRVAGRAVTVIGAKAGERDAPSVWLDPEYGVVRFIRRERLPKGEGLVDLSFSEHRPLAGAFYFPHRQEAFVDGKLLILIVVRSVMVNTPLADTLFDPEGLRRTR